jgi:RNase P subunit RPR2
VQREARDQQRAGYNDEERQAGYDRHMPSVRHQDVQDREGVEMAEGYCLKCKTKREMQNAQAITMKNGKPATTGTCPVCGTKIYKIGKA